MAIEALELALTSQEKNSNLFPKAPNREKSFLILIHFLS